MPKHAGTWALGSRHRQWQPAARAEDGRPTPGRSSAPEREREREREVIHEVPDSSHETHLASPCKALYPYPGKNGRHRPGLWTATASPSEPPLVLVKLAPAHHERGGSGEIRGRLATAQPHQHHRLSHQRGRCGQDQLAGHPPSHQLRQRVCRRTVVHTLKPTAARVRRQWPALPPAADPPLGRSAAGPLVARPPVRSRGRGHGHALLAARRRHRAVREGRRQMRWFAHSSHGGQPDHHRRRALVDHPPARWTYLGGSSLGSGATSMAVPKGLAVEHAGVAFYGVFDDSGSEGVRAGHRLRCQRPGR